MNIVNPYENTPKNTGNIVNVKEPLCFENSFGDLKN